MARPSVRRRRGESTLKQLEILTQRMEDSAIAEYIEFIRSPRRVIWANLLGGLARGLGFAVGASVLAAAALYLLGKVAWANLPLIGKYIADVLEFVELNR